MVKVLQHFTPILVDGDTEKPICRKYGASGFPTTVFADMKGEPVLKTVGAQAVPQFLNMAEAAAKKARAGKPSKDFATLTKANDDLDKALGKSAVAAALDAIARIEKVNRPGAMLDRAVAEKERLLAEGRKRLDEAKAAAEAGDADAVKALRKIAADYKGTDLATEAAALVKACEAKEPK